jgi:hypothetical protein
MFPVQTEDFELNPPDRSTWRTVLDLGVSLLIVVASMLIVNVLTATPASAQTSKAESHIGRGH